TELDSELFADMVNEQKILRKVEVFDYQGICEKPKDDADSAAFRVRPAQVFASCVKVAGFVWQLLLRLISSITYRSTGHRAYAWTEYEDEDEITGIPNRTVVTPCLKIHDLYELNNTSAFTKMP